MTSRSYRLSIVGSDVISCVGRLGGGGGPWKVVQGFYVTFIHVNMIQVFGT